MQQTTKTLAIVLLAISGLLQAQGQLTTIADGGNKKASVSERIGITDITIQYNRPGVKGREGAIWGRLIPTGYHDLGFGTSKAAPWRAGANENTTMSFSTDVMVEGKPLPAGTYGFFIAYDPNECTLIFSRNSSSWGSFFYDQKEDALRVNVKPVSSDKSVEWLKYEFMDEKENVATVALEWEKLVIPFKVEVDYPGTQLASFRSELRSAKGFTWNAWMQAAQFCAQHKTNLEEGLAWADKSISEPFVGDKNFQTMATKAQILRLLNREGEATALMKEALPLGKVTELHGYARMLLQQKKVKEAFDVFQINYNRNPKEFTTMVGMARGYSASGNFAKAIDFAQKALPLAPNQGNKDNVEQMIKKLQEGKDIN